jgi:hypothetical protein
MFGEQPELLLSFVAPIIVLGGAIALVRRRRRKLR